MLAETSEHGRREPVAPAGLLNYSRLVPPGPDCSRRPEGGGLDACEVKPTAARALSQDPARGGGRAPGPMASQGVEVSAVHAVPVLFPESQRRVIKFQGVLVALLGAIPWVVMPALVSEFVERPLLVAGVDWGTRLLQHFPRSTAAESAPPAPVPPAADSLGELPPSAPTEQSRATPSGAIASPPSRAKKPVPVRISGYRVSATQVLSLASAGYVPGAVAVAAHGQQPAGLRLAGVSRLGLGPRDGDVLFSVAGTRVADLGAVASLVLTARARQATTLNALLWRPSGAPEHGAGTIHALTVEMPYVPARAQPPI